MAMPSSSSSAASAPEAMFTSDPKGQAELKTHEFRSFDGPVDEDIELDEYHGHLRSQQRDEGFTRVDAREMKRMGKKQELRVCGIDFVTYLIFEADRFDRETSELCRQLRLLSFFKVHGKSFLQQPPKVSRTVALLVSFGLTSGHSSAFHS